MLHLARTRTNCLMMKLWVDDKLLHDNVGLPQLVVVAVHPTFLSLYCHLLVSNPIPLPRSLTIKERQNFLQQSPFRPRTGNKITQATILQYVGLCRISKMTDQAIIIIITLCIMLKQEIYVGIETRVYKVK